MGVGGSELRCGMLNIRHWLQRAHAWRRKKFQGYGNKDIITTTPPPLLPLLPATTRALSCRRSEIKPKNFYDASFPQIINVRKSRKCG